MEKKNNVTGLRSPKLAEGFLIFKLLLSLKSWCMSAYLKSYKVYSLRLSRLGQAKVRTESIYRRFGRTCRLHFQYFWHTQTPKFKEGSSFSFTTSVSIYQPTRRHVYINKTGRTSNLVNYTGIEIFPLLWCYAAFIGTYLEIATEFLAKGKDQAARYFVHSTKVYDVTRLCDATKCNITPLFAEVE
jgi:hypothetical protein